MGDVGEWGTGGESGGLCLSERDVGLWGGRGGWELALWVGDGVELDERYEL